MEEVKLRDLKDTPDLPKMIHDRQSYGNDLAGSDDGSTTFLKGCSWRTAR